MRVASELHLYTDGACSSGVGGFGCALVNPATEKHVSFSDGPFSETTNNQMEMMAVIAGLRFAQQRVGSSRILVISDSKYVINGITEWIHNWKKNGWFTASNKPVKNVELWQRMEACRDAHEFTRFEWVKGHNGNKFNELADRLAVNKRTSSARAKPLEVAV